MGAIKTKLESFKKPRQAKVMRGSGKMPNFGPKGSGSKLNLMPAMRMAMAQQRRQLAEQDSETQAEAMTVRRQGTMESRVPRFEMMNELIARNDQMLESLLLDQ